jgi:hypothetical protein
MDESGTARREMSKCLDVAEMLIAARDNVETVLLADRE